LKESAKDPPLFQQPLRRQFRVLDPEEREAIFTDEKPKLSSSCC
jgi:hypothetical protein